MPARPARLLAIAIACLLGVAVAPASAADLFDRHTSEQLRTALDDTAALPSLSMQESARLKSLGANVGGPLLVVRTNDGNLAKIVVRWGFRRSGEELVPVVVLDRTVTYRGDRRDVTAARDDNVMLFAGFAYNLDIGQVVPEGQGGDLWLTAEGRLEPLGDATIVALEKSLLNEPVDDAPDPADHDGVLPRDFAGTWQVDVDGRWTGELLLAVDENGRASGRYTSDESKSTYDVAGRVSGVPHRLRLTFYLDNVQQEVDAYLWTKDKRRMAGTATLADRPFGFLAERATADAKE
jgi:hypothetical protein